MHNNTWIYKTNVGTGAKLNILMVSSNYPPRVGGPATTVPEISKRLVAKGFSVTVLSAHIRKSKYHEENEYFEVYRAPATYIGVFQNPISVIIRIISMGMLGKLLSLKYKPDILHAHDTNISALAALFIKKVSFKKRPLIVKYAGDLALEYIGMSSDTFDISLEDIQGKQNRIWKLLYQIQKAIFISSDIVQVQSEFQRSSVKNFYGIEYSKIRVLPNPVDTSRFKPLKVARNEDQLNLLTVSRLLPWKGLHHLFNALPKVIESVEQRVKLFIIGEGEGDYEVKLKKLRKELGLEENIEFLGRVENERLPEYLNSCDIFIQPSLYEPFGISIIEAMACECAVIATKTGGVPEIITDGEHGILVNPGIPEELSQKIIYLSRDKKERKRLGENARWKVISSYSYESVIAKLVDIYSDSISLS